MTYRSEKDAQHEQTRARIVRIRNELHALESQIGAPPTARRARWGWLGAGVAVGAALTSLLFGGMLLVPRFTGRAPLEGAPDAPREQPSRSEVDTELVRLHEEMQGCAPAGFSGTVQADVTFAGSNGAIADIQTVNHGDTTLQQGMVTCIEQTFERIGTARFRARSYLYRTTLVWAHGTLLANPAQVLEPMSALDGTER